LGLYCIGEPHEYILTNTNICEHGQMDTRIYFLFFIFLLNMFKAVPYLRVYTCSVSLACKICATEWVSLVSLRSKCTGAQWATCAVASLSGHSSGYRGARLTFAPLPASSWSNRPVAAMKWKRCLRSEGVINSIAIDIVPRPAS
jgi:hypothetical protein